MGIIINLPNRIRSTKLYGSKNTNGINRANIMAGAMTKYLKCRETFKSFITHRCHDATLDWIYSIYIFEVRDENQ